jgi:hypothetical protein
MEVERSGEGILIEYILFTVEVVCSTPSRDGTTADCVVQLSFTMLR